MKKTVVSKILAGLLMVTVAATLAGCTVEKTVTKTETHTDANGNTTTTTTVTNNGQTTKTTEETSAAEEGAEKIVATIAFENEADFDIEALYFACGTSDEWGEDILGDQAPLADGERLTFKNGFTYSEESLLWDLLAEDADGNTVEFEGLDMSYAADPENITVLLEYDEDEEGYTVTVM